LSLIELKLTLLEDVLKKNEDKWRNEYIREHWKFVSPVQNVSHEEILERSCKWLK